MKLLLKYFPACLAAMIWLSPHALAQTINRMEYFIDTDPGFGAATAISLAPGANLANIQVAVPIQSLNNGFHALNVRSQDANGRWSLTSRAGFVKMPATAPIREMEYFFDVDPGFGRATPVAFNAANDLSGFVAQVNITGLSVGQHKLFVRSKEGADDWSLTNMMTVNITASDPAPLINVNSLTDYNPCAGTSFRMAYHATGNHTPGNRFDVELSNAVGVFDAPITIGSVLDTADRIVTVHLPKNLIQGGNYRIRVNSSQQPVIGIANALPISIRPAPQLGPDTAVVVVCQQDLADLSGVFPTAGYTLQWSLANPAAAPLGQYQLVATNSFGCRDTALATVRQDILRWVGTVSSAWDNPANWNTGTLPTPQSHVLIPAGVAHACQLKTADATIASLQLATGAIFTAATGRQLIIAGGCSPLPPL